ncbi:MAG: LytTR family DNA-binding domain-containing protein [Ahrensia sp.]|nr:LytTR family DNA-binding domain-containing protein [Ahrensia sp.]
MNEPENFADAPPLQFALRELRYLIERPRFWIGMLAVIAILAVAAPFNTGDVLGFPGLLTYWGAITVSTFFLAMLVSAGVGQWATRHGAPELLAWLIGGAASSIPVFALVSTVNALVMGFSKPVAAAWFGFYLNVLAISMAVSIIYYLAQMGRGSRPEVPPMSAAVEIDPFLARLPKEIGADLISLQAQDHYLKVTTTRGNAMILMRLSDAEKELSGAEGLRVHRSWWVSRKHVTDLSRDQNRPILTMSDGQTVPVSRTYLRSVRDALER